MSASDKDGIHVSEPDTRIISIERGDKLDASDIKKRHQELLQMRKEGIIPPLKNGVQVEKEEIVEGVKTEDVMEPLEVQKTEGGVDVNKKRRRTSVKKEADPKNSERGKKAWATRRKREEALKKTVQRVVGEPAKKDAVIKPEKSAKKRVVRRSVRRGTRRRARSDQPVSPVEALLASATSLRDRLQSVLKAVQKVDSQLFGCDIPAKLLDLSGVDEKPGAISKVEALLRATSDGLSHVEAVFEKF